MDLEAKINISQFKICGLKGDSNYEIFGFIHINGKKLETCSYSCVVKVDTNRWLVQDATSRYEISEEMALSNFSPYLVFYRKSEIE